MLFGINQMKYQVASAKGRLIDCRLCNVKRIIKQNGSVIKYNFEIKKFEVVYIKPTILNYIKEYFSN